MKKENKDNLLVILSGNSGSGKTTTMRYIAKNMKCEIGDIFRNEIISLTTREPREGEVEGRDYYFVDFETANKLEFAEKVNYLGTIYGVTKEEYQNKNGNSPASIIVEGQGKEQFEEINNNTLSIFLLASKEELTKRLNDRGDDTEVINKRINNYEKEAEYRHSYDIVINVDGLSISEVASSVANEVKKRIQSRAS